MMFSLASLPYLGFALLTSVTNGWTPAECEVVGGGGRMGSQWLSHHSQVVPRGVCPGCLSPKDCPIYVCVPSAWWNQIFQQTPTNRRNDLVWIGNGLVPDSFINTTVVVPHYGILKVGEKPTTSPSSPPTLVYGKHAQNVVDVLDADCVQVEIVSSLTQIQVAAARKLLWASCMWLLCHDTAERPLSAAQVYASQQQSKLKSLVQELFPVLQKITGDHSISFEDTMTYLEAYSKSMPDAVPSLGLALSEVQDRNGVWLQWRDKYPQPLHEELLCRVGGKKALQKALEPLSDADCNDTRVIDLENLGMSVYGKTNGALQHPCHSAVVVGAGILGSAVAMNLARRGRNVTVVDRLSSGQLGLTTPASWAWINANQKTPPYYKLLNQLGMMAWHRDSVISSLPTWGGGLVQYKNGLEPSAFAGYETEGPLTQDRLSELEPNANFVLEDGPVYFFQNEGCVDPGAAVNAMRQFAMNHGATFLSNLNVTSLLRDGSGRVTGVECEDTTLNKSPPTQIMSDVVVVAAGIGSAVAALGGIPLLYRPGRLAFARPQSKTSSTSLRRVLVDTVNEAHVLQRRDGSIVIGGGFLDLGGSTSRYEKPSKQQSPENVETGDHLLAGAQRLAPSTLSQSSQSHVAEAVRPIPQDGLPAVGHLSPGLYTLITHSGVTIAPFLAPLVATELIDGVELDLLEPYRPGRFFQPIQPMS